MRFWELWEIILEAEAEKINPHRAMIQNDALRAELKNRIDFKMVRQLGGLAYEGTWSVVSPSGDTLQITAQAVKQDERLPHTSEPMNSWGILFQVDGASTVTGAAGSAAIDIYNGLFVFVHELMRIQSRKTPVEALQFLEFEPSMLPVYETFIKIFLPKEQFVRYDQKKLLSVKALERIKAINPGVSGDLDAQIATAREEQRSRVEEIRKQKNALLRGAAPT